MNGEIQAYLQKAREALRDAEVMLSQDRYAEAVSRAYYVMYHAASAMLGQRGMTSESHAGVKAKFGEIFAKTGEVDRKFGHYLTQALELREDADYVTEATRIITKEVATDQVTKATEFLRMAEEHLP